LATSLESSSKAVVTAGLISGSPRAAHKKAHKTIVLG
jgi:hypothetical protein